MFPIEQRRSFKLCLLAVVVIGQLVIGCGKDVTAPTPTTSFAGVVSFNATLSRSEPIANYAAEYRAIAAAGVKGAQTAAPWNSLEPDSTGYDLTMLTNPFFGLGALSGYGFTTIFLNIPVVALADRTMPADIAGLNFNNATVKTRLRRLIDRVIPHLHSGVVYVAFGNEVDAYFSAHGGEWGQFIELVEDARVYLKSFRPMIRVGVTTTFAAATGSQAADIATLNANMDMIALTYYPVDPETFVPRDPSTVSADMQVMMNLSPTIPIVLQEWGYPSSRVLTSSEQEQAEFVAHSFTAWRSNGATRFPFISFFKWRDWDSAECQARSGQSPGQPLYEFLCSLGLLYNNQTQKAAYQEFLHQLAGR